MELRVIQYQYSLTLQMLKAVIKVFMVRDTEALQCPQLNCAPVTVLSA